MLKNHIAFLIDTYGCKINQNESQAIREGWLSAGCVETDNPADADYIIINSCAITAKAERDARNAIYRHRRLSPNAKIILGGCASGLLPDFRPAKGREAPAADLCESNKNLLSPPHVRLCAPRKDNFFADISAYRRGRPVIKVQDGCSQKCSYCIVPYIRGNPQSRDPLATLAECRRLARSGYGELILSGINLGQYRHSGGGDFWRLLSFLDKELSREFASRLRLRISSAEPGQLTDEALSILSDCELIAPHLHLSMQHVSPPILKAMGRTRYSAESTLAKLEKARRFWPRMGLGADFIVGFPGETENDFQRLLEAPASLGLTYAHVFPYSKRPGTRAAGMDNQIPDAVKKGRAELLRNRAAERKICFLKSQAGAEATVAPDAGKDGAGSARGVNEYYANCQLASGQKFPSLNLTKVRVVSVEGDSLVCELAN